MTDFKGGQTVYDSNGKMFEYHHTFSGVHYCYPLHEFQDENGAWYDQPADQLVGMAAIYDKPPAQKLSDKMLDMLRQIDDLKVEEAKIKGAANAARHERQAAELDLKRFEDQFGVIRRIGKMMDGEPVVPVRLSIGEFMPPEAAGGTRELAALKLLWEPQTKKWRFASPRKSYSTSDAHDTLMLFDTVEEANDFVSVLFEDVCKKIMRDKGSFNPGRSYTTPHIEVARQWVAKWPHLSVPQEMLDAEEAYLAAARDAQIEEARRRLQELQGG